MIDMAFDEIHSHVSRVDRHQYTVDVDGVGLLITSRSSLLLPSPAALRWTPAALL
jgi:hypothetical protein